MVDASRGAGVDGTPDGTPDDVRPRTLVPRSLKVLSRGSFEEALERAVARAFARQGGLTPALAQQLGRLVRDEAAALIGRSARQMRGMSRREFLLQLDRARDRTLAARDAAREELLGVQQELERARSLYSSRREALRWVGEGKVDLERLHEGLEALLVSWERSELDRSELREAMARLAVGTAREEIDAACRRLASEYGEQVDRLERRIKKLTASLEATERALQTVSRLKAIDPGVASIYRTVQGLRTEDDLARAKRAMLEDLFEQNRVLQAR